MDARKFDVWRSLELRLIIPILLLGYFVCHTRAVSGNGTITNDTNVTPTTTEGEEIEAEDITTTSAPVTQLNGTDTKSRTTTEPPGEVELNETGPPQRAGKTTDEIEAEDITTRAYVSKTDGQSSVTSTGREANQGKKQTSTSTSTPPSDQCPNFYTWNEGHNVVLRRGGCEIYISPDESIRTFGYPGARPPRIFVSNLK